jgi:DNA-binding response OmpR family regulator
MHAAVHRSTSHRRILIADDEPHIRRILQTVLEMAGFEVDLRRDGTDALEAVSGSKHYDLILLDIMMPGATGLEVLEKIRAMDGRKFTPVVILTAKGQGEDRQAAFSLGADDFLTKPFSPKKLLARIHEIIDGD